MVKILSSIALMALLTVNSSVSANMFLNKNLINKEDYDPNTFHFEMVYGLEILTLQNDLTKNMTLEFFEDCYTK